MIWAFIGGTVFGIILSVLTFFAICCVVAAVRSEKGDDNDKP